MRDGEENTPYYKDKDKDVIKEQEQSSE